jgi:hypothetical protein
LQQRCQPRASHVQAAVPAFDVNPSLRIVWRRAANFAMQDKFLM